MFYTTMAQQNGRMRPYRYIGDMPVPAVYTTSKPATGGSLLVNEINDDCVGCWIFNEATGSTITDLSPSGKNGTLSGAASWGLSDQGDACVEFDGSDDGATIAGFGLVAPEDEITFLFKQKIASADMHSTFRIEQSTYTLNTHCPWTGGIVYWDAGNPSGKRISYSSSGDAGNWVVWVMTASLSGSYSRIYKNGTMVADQTITPGFVRGNVPMTLGYNSGSGWIGSLDVLRVWNRALSDSEIGILSAGPFTGIGD